MSDYTISETLYATDFGSSAGSSWGNIYTYDFKIDIRGNVYVKYGSNHYSDPQPIPSKEMFSIIDNTPVPEYIIELFMFLIKKHCVSIYNCGRGNTACRLEKMEMFFDIVKGLKKSVENIIKNSQDITEIETQVKLYKTKNKMLETDLEKMNERIKGMQIYCDNALKKNEDLKKENIELQERIRILKEELKQTKLDSTQKIQELETNIRFTKMMSNNKKEQTKQSNIKFSSVCKSQPCYTSESYFTNCISNPEGANIYTKPNASNNMVYDIDTGIYEPEKF